MLFQKMFMISYLSVGQVLERYTYRFEQRTCFFVPPHKHDKFLMNVRISKRMFFNDQTQFEKHFEVEWFENCDYWRLFLNLLDFEQWM